MVVQFPQYKHSTAVEKTLKGGTNEKKTHGVLNT